MKKSFVLLSLVISSGLVVLPDRTAVGQTTERTFTDGGGWSPAAPTLGGAGTINERWNINGSYDYSNAGTTTINNTTGRAVVIGSNTAAGAASKLTISAGTLSLQGTGSSIVGAPSNLSDGTAELHLNGGNLTTTQTLGISGNGSASATSTARVSSGSTLTAAAIQFAELQEIPNRQGLLIVETGGTVVTGSISERFNINSFVQLNGGTIQASGDANKTWINGRATSYLAGNDLQGPQITLGAAGGTLQSALAGQIVSSNISGEGAMTVTGGGSIEFTRTNTYSGGTTVAADTTLKLGTMTFAGNTVNGTIGTGSLNLLGTLDATAAGVTVGNGTVDLETLTLNGNILGNATLNGVELSGFGDGAGTDVSGNLSLAGFSEIKWEFAGNEFNLLSIGGTFDFGTGTVFDLGTASLTNTFYALGNYDGMGIDFSNVTLAGSSSSQYFLSSNGTEFGITAVPEPSSMALLGLVGTAVAVRRRMKKAKA